MNKRLIEITRQRAKLQEKTAQLRDEIATAYTPVQTTLGYADYGIEAVHKVTRHPFISGGIATLILLLIPKRWKVALAKNALPLGLIFLKKFWSKTDTDPKV